MKFALYQIVVIAIAGLMIGQGFKNFFKRDGGQTLLKLIVRIIIWGGMAAIVAFPGLSNDLAKLIGIQDNINAVIMAGFLLIFLMIFKLLSALERLEQQITTITRQKTLNEMRNRERSSIEKE